VAVSAVAAAVDGVTVAVKVAAKAGGVLLSVIRLLVSRAFTPH